jgi:serine/threonine-protein kinase
MGTDEIDLPSVDDGGEVEANRPWDGGGGAPAGPAAIAREGTHEPPSEAAAPNAEATALVDRIHGIFAPGSEFGVYVIGSCIGEGGMARIYRAEHAGLRRQVALKVMLHGFSRDPEGRERFIREARIAAAIKHPNVVNIFDVGVHENIPYLVMELLEGTDLEAMIADKGALDESLILDIMVPVVAGLSAVHDAGIVHRDLKSGNIFLSRGRYEDLEPKLLDFGISRAPDPHQPRITNHGHLMGTPSYMSPEGVRGGELTFLSDQYSLGVVMYECATGHAPYLGTNLHDLVHMISAGAYRPPDQRNPKISRRLAAIITRAMSLDPERRFPDLRAMGRELLSLAGQRTRITWGLSFGPLRSEAEGRGPVASAPVEPPPAKRARSLGAKLLPVGLAAIGALIAFAMFGVWAVGSSLRHRSSASSAPEAGATTFMTQAIGLHPSPQGDPIGAPAAAAPPLATPEVSASTPSPASRGPRSSPISTGSTRKQRRGLHPPASAEARRRQPSSQDLPDWEIPVPTSAPPQARLRETTLPLQNSNGAPIFD